MQPWSHSNLISRCGTARVPHKHNCLLGTMISNEMRLHHHCNLSGKISTREWVPVPGSLVIWGAARNLHLSLPISSTLSLSKIFSPNIPFGPYGSFFLYGRIFPEYLMLDRASVKAVTITDYCQQTRSKMVSLCFILLVFSHHGFKTFFFFSAFLKWKSVLQVGDRSLLSWHALWNSRDELYVDWKRSSLSRSLL